MLSRLKEEGGGSEDHHSSLSRRQAVGSRTFSWLHQQEAAAGRLSPAVPCSVAAGGRGAEKGQQRNCAAPQPFKAIGEKCVLGIELLLKHMMPKVTCFRRAVLFVTRALWVTVACWCESGVQE